MPLLIGVVVIGLISGLLASRRIALIVTGVASTFVMIAWVRAVTDGKGNDPAWGLGIAAAVCLVGLALAAWLPRLRRAGRVTQ